MYRKDWKLPSLQGTSAGEQLGQARSVSEALATHDWSKVLGTYRQFNPRLADQLQEVTSRYAGGFSLHPIQGITQAHMNLTTGAAEVYLSPIDHPYFAPTIFAHEMGHIADNADLIVGRSQLFPGMPENLRAEYAAWAHRERLFGKQPFRRHLERNALRTYTEMDLVGGTEYVEKRMMASEHVRDYLDASLDFNNYRAKTDFSSPQEMSEHFSKLLDSQERLAEVIGRVDRGAGEALVNNTKALRRITGSGAEEHINRAIGRLERWAGRSSVSDKILWERRVLNAKLKQAGGDATRLTPFYRNALNESLAENSEVAAARFSGKALRHTASEVEGFAKKGVGGLLRKIFSAFGSPADIARVLEGPIAMKAARAVSALKSAVPVPNVEGSVVLSMFENRIGHYKMGNAKFA